MATDPEDFFAGCLAALGIFIVAIFALGSLALVVLLWRWAIGW